jgi:hypothetical protein
VLESPPLEDGCKTPTDALDLGQLGHADTLAGGLQDAASALDGRRSTLTFDAGRLREAAAPPGHETTSSSTGRGEANRSPTS